MSEWMNVTLSVSVSVWEVSFVSLKLKRIVWKSNTRELDDDVDIVVICTSCRITPNWTLGVKISIKWKTCFCNSYQSSQIYWTALHKSITRCNIRHLEVSNPRFCCCIYNLVFFFYIKLVYSMFNINVKNARVRSIYTILLFVSWLVS